jgi:hypothetical protein
MTQRIPGETRDGIVTNFEWTDIQYTDVQE